MASLLNNLGGTLGFGEFSLTRNDDSYQQGVDLTTVFGASGLNFFGTQYNYVAINNNGNITLSNASSGGLSQYTPFGLSNGGYAIIAPFFGDVDTRLSSGGVADANQVTPTAGGNSRGSDLVWYDMDATGNGTLTVTWDDVGYYDFHTEKLNTFQLQIVGQGGGNFQIIFRYEDVNWTTGDASDGVDGLGGVVSRAGYSTGDGTSWYELAQSGSQDAMLALEDTLGNTGVAGYYEFSVRSGTSGADLMNGTELDDLLAGAGAGDTLNGLGGNDSLIGNEGADTLVGGSGNDTYTIDGSDTIVESAGGGTDTVVSPVSYALGDHLENLRLTGNDNINGTGNALNNVMFGNGGNNVLDGQGGSDTVDYSLASGGIVVDLNLSSGQYISGQSTDTLLNMESIIGSIYDDTLTGTAFGNMLNGNNGNDTINAGADNDILLGGDGSDVLNGGDGTDLAVFAGNRAGTLTRTDGGFTLAASGGTDTLNDIERLQFADTYVALDLLPTQNGGQSLELIGTLAHPLINNASVVGLFISLFDSGYSMQTLSQLAVDVGLVGQLAGSNSDTDLARLVLRNVIGSDTNAAAVDLLVSFMDGRVADLSHAGFIAAIAGMEINQEHIGLVGLQQTGVEYVI